MSERKRIGKYEIAEQIGVGGFGVVYKAWDPFIQRWVAIKTCNASDREATQRFFREAQLAGALAHPNITLIFDFGVEGESPYFVQEFLTGADLDEVVSHRSLSLEAVLAILVQVGTGLEFAHSKGIVHRDIKPANIRVLEDGTVKIMDFGIAKSLQSESRLTQTGVALGTAGYLAPEQLAGKPLDQRTDMFSLGIMAYELVTGVRPFVGPNLSNVIYQILHQEPVPPRQRNPACPERLQKAILKALAKEPENRFPSVRELVMELKAVLHELTPQRTTDRRESTADVVREELARIGQVAAPAAPTPPAFDARSFERLPGETSPVTQGGLPPRRRRRWPLVLGAVVVVAALGGWAALSPGGGVRTLLFRPTPTPTPRPTRTPTPSPTAVPTPTQPISVELFVDPPSDVTVDGRPLGRVQTSTVELAPGTHQLTQSIAGYREKTYTVEVTTPGQSIKLRLPPFGLLTVMNELGVPFRGTRVLLNGRDVGALPLRDVKVEAGTVEMTVIWPDDTRWSETLTVPANGTVRRSVRPAPATP